MTVFQVIYSSDSDVVSYSDDITLKQRRVSGQHIQQIVD